MKICFVSSEYPPFHGGGIGTYTANMSRMLAEAGHEVHVIANAWGDRGGSAGDVQESERLWVHRIDALSSDYQPRPPHEAAGDTMGELCRQWESSLFWSTLVADELAKLHARHQFDVVEFPECFAESYTSLRRRRLGDPKLNVPITLTLHSPIHEIAEHNLLPGTENWVRRRAVMEDYCIRHADRLSSPSANLAKIVSARLDLDPATSPIDVIHNPMDFDSIEPRGGEPAVENDHPTLLFVGRLEPRKGVAALVDAALKLLPEFPELKVHLVGRDCEAGVAPGSMTEHLRQGIPANWEANFEFEGLRPREEILGRYARSTLCVFPAPWDNFPYTCCEAMAAGACVVGSDNSGMAEMIEHGSSGFLFSAQDPDSLVAVIRKALLDPELRAAVAQAAPARIRSLCDPQRAVQAREAHYEKSRESQQQKALVVGKPSGSAIKLALCVGSQETAVR